MDRAGARGKVRVDAKVAQEVRLVVVEQAQAGNAFVPHAAQESLTSGECPVWKPSAQSAAN